MYCNNLYVKAIISALVNSNNYNIYNILKKIVRYIVEKKIVRYIRNLYVNINIGDIRV